VTASFVSAELDTLLFWMVERDRVRAAKEAGAPKPWTADPLLRDFRWCNVRRMDDRVSRWLLRNWYDDRHDLEYQLFDAAFARLVNWPDALEEIRDQRNPNDVRTILTTRAARGDKVFTGAYVVPGVPGKNKVDSVCDLVDRIILRAAASPGGTLCEDLQAATMRAMWVWFMSFDGLGSFLAGQMVADLCTQSIGMDWPDRGTWAPLGPGSARGMNRVLGRPKDHALAQAEFEQLLPDLVFVVKERVPALWKDRQLVAMDIQNCLCEFDKYRRLQLGEGKVRARYDGAAAAPTTAGLFS
jgi:hypothetical protein